jgi:hypothetical protein
MLSPLRTLLSPVCQRSLSPHEKVKDAFVYEIGHADQWIFFCGTTLTILHLFPFLTGWQHDKHQRNSTR